VALEHDEKLVAIVMTVILMPRARLEHGPADHVVGVGGFLVDQELHLHVDPAIVALEAFDLRHVFQIRAVHDRVGLAFVEDRSRAFDGLAERATEFFSR